jgi:hypothetical protein
MSRAMGTSGNGVSSRTHSDLLRTSAALWLWCLPVLIVIVTNSLYNGQGGSSFAIAGVLLIIATLWIGVACYANGRRCGRLHCKIDGILLPLLSLVGLLNLLRVTSFGWAVYSNALAVIVILSFAAEYFSNGLHRKYRSP